MIEKSSKRESSDSLFFLPTNRLSCSALLFFHGLIMEFFILFFNKSFHSSDFSIKLHKISCYNRISFIKF